MKEKHLVTCEAENAHCSGSSGFTSCCYKVDGVFLIWCLPLMNLNSSSYWCVSIFHYFILCSYKFLYRQNLHWISKCTAKILYESWLKSLLASSFLHLVRTYLCRVPHVWRFWQTKLRGTPKLYLDLVTLTVQLEYELEQVTLGVLQTYNNIIQCYSLSNVFIFETNLLLHEILTPSETKDPIPGLIIYQYTNN